MPQTVELNEQVWVADHAGNLHEDPQLIDRDKITKIVMFHVSKALDDSVNAVHEGRGKHSTANEFQECTNRFLDREIRVMLLTLLGVPVNTIDKLVDVEMFASLELHEAVAALCGPASLVQPALVDRYYRHLYT